MINVRGVRIFGAPHHPSSPYSVNDTFGASRGARQQVYKNVGPGVHIFATHCPPFGVRDLEGSSRHTGCAEQLGVLRRVRPMAHVFGRSLVNRGVSRFWHVPKEDSGGFEEIIPDSVDECSRDVEIEMTTKLNSSQSSSAQSRRSYRKRRRTSNTAEGTLIINASSTGNEEATRHGGAAPPIILEVVLHRPD